MTEGLVPATGEIVNIDLSMARAPEQVLQEAQKAAAALKTVISGKQKPVIFRGEQYLEFEDWQTCGRFYGLAARVVSTAPVDFDGVRGFEARAEVINVVTGQIVSAAEAMCLNDEENWQGKPLFQLRSMSQTRACAKALRNVLAWVVVLAGYRPTPAEEMTGQERTNGSIRSPQRKTPTNGNQKAAVISEPQRRRLFAIAKTAGWSDEELKNLLLNKYGFEQSADITRDAYDAICKALEAGTDAA